MSLLWFKKGGADAFSSFRNICSAAMVTCDIAPHCDECRVSFNYSYRSTMRDNHDVSTDNGGGAVAFEVRCLSVFNTDDASDATKLGL